MSELATDPEPTDPLPVGPPTLRSVPPVPPRRRNGSIAAPPGVTVVITAPDAPSSGHWGQRLAPAEIVQTPSTHDARHHLASHPAATVIIETGADHAERDHAERDRRLATLVAELTHDGHHVVVHGTAAITCVRSSMLAGARAYLFPPTPARAAAEARAALRRDADGDADTAESTLVEVTCAHGKLAHLTRREVEILHYVAEGLTNHQISDLLGLSALTVKSHLSRISHRLHADDRAHLVLLALRSDAIA